MKKIIIIEILMLFVFCVLTACSINHFSAVHLCIQNINYFENLTEIQSNMSEAQRLELIEVWRNSMQKGLIYAISTLLAALAILAVMIIITIKDFPVFKPLTDKLADKRAARKEARSQAKAKQAAIAKQERIDQLKAELDELQKDE